MRRSCLPIFLALVILSSVPPASAKPKGSTKKADHFVYSGKLHDESGAPLAGIYPLTFALHRDGKTSKKMWFEQHWVAIEDGTYTLDLGHRRKLPRTLDITSTHLSVTLTGGGELFREQLSERNLPGAPQPATPGALKTPASEKIAKPAPRAEATRAARPVGGSVDYAKEAGLAYEAELAKNAERIGNLSLEQLDERYRKKSGARVGKSRRYTSSAGGEGGRPFRLVCPKGYVAVGVRGAAGIYLDSIEVICAPLE